MKIAVLQMRCGEDARDNLERACAMVRRAADNGARLALPPELFERQYFCKTQRADCLGLAAAAADNPAVVAMQKLAAELRVVIPVSFFERAGRSLFNSLAMMDADGRMLGVYRKSHLPDGPGYQEKYYFSPGDTGFRVWQTQVGRIGAAICWDQWFPEAARAMALDGADILLYPTAIGDEPHLTAAGQNFDSSDHWQTAMRGHAAANLIPVAAANRIGDESQKDSFGGEVKINFYGRSFIADHFGKIAAEAGREEETIIYSDLDFAAVAEARAAWGVFRDRRPDLYRALTAPAPESA